MQQQVAELQQSEAGVKRELENSQGLLRIERKEQEGVQDQMMAEIEEKGKQLSDLHSTSDALSANKQQLESDLESARSEINHLHTTHKSALEEKVLAAVCKEQD